MDITRNNLNGLDCGDDSPLFARNSMIWGVFLVGVVIGFLVVYLVVAQPMFAQLAQMERQMVAMDADLQSLVGARQEAWEAGNLLSDLNALKNQLRDARATVREVRTLRQDLLEESMHTAAASAALRSLGKLQEVALDQEELAAPALRALEQLAQIQNRLVAEHIGTPKAEETLADLDRIRRDLTELLSLKAQLAENGDGLEAAKSTAGQLLDLKDQILAQGQDAETALTNANRLIVLKDELKEEGSDIPTALAHLDKLFEIKAKLVEQSTAVADAVLNLEILSDFQTEFGEQLRTLSRMREGMLQIVLLEGTLGRVAKLLEPLAQIANVRRLSDRELREAARSILENRSTRISSKPEEPRDSATPAPSDPFTQSPEAGYDGGAKRDQEQGPAALPLPLSN